MAEYYIFLQYNIGRTRMDESIKVVENIMLINCPIIKYDINIFEDIWGPNLGYLKGKTTR